MKTIVDCSLADFYTPPLAGDQQFVALAAAIVYGLPNTIELLSRYRPGLMTYVNDSYDWTLARWRPNWGWSIALGLLAALSLYRMQGQPPFLYQGF